ncbi:unnamed protein product [Paramecium octaurelia]|uniref:THO complex subunit 2 n=1 Tax=Paramecium octaurelia TaxID=43137 RepID=A0A8S1W1R3_PAROT|nr:unnamed protein product [Paramecium octaurelia]
MSDILVITQELINDVDRTINYFTVSDPRRKNKFIYQYLSDFYLKQKIPFDKVIQFLRNIQQNEASFTILLENLYLCTMVIQQSSDSRKLLIQLMQSLAERLTQTQKQVFFDNFDEEVLWECGFVQQDTFSQRKRKINTDINFCQNKFWSMKDENEGYSKLMVEILDAAKHTHIYDEEIKQRIENIIHLIGYFDLDPDRVVDIIIQSWTEYPYSLSYVKILKQFKCISVCQFLGKRFESIVQTLSNNNNISILMTKMANSAQVMQTDQKIPDHKLIIITATALKYKLFELGNIWKYLQPNDQDFSKIFEDLAEDSYKFYKSFDQVMQVEELRDSRNNNDQSEKLKKDLFGQQLYNQKLWLMQGLIHINAFNIFQELYKSFEGIVDFTIFLPIKRTLADLIDWMVDPLHEQLYNKTLFKSRNREQKKFIYDPNCTTAFQIKQLEAIDEDAISILNEILSIFSPYIGEYPLVFHKLCKVLISSQNPDVQPLILDHLIPAIQSGECLPIVIELWKYLGQLDFRKRFDCYSKWKDIHQFSTINQTIRAAQLTKEHIRSFFNKIDKDNKDKMMVKFAKLSHNQPMIVMNVLRRNRLEIPDNNSVIVHTLGLATPLSLDILQFIMIQWLCDFNDESKVRDKDIECRYWFKNIAQFIASVLRKYYTIDMQGLFAYLIDVFSTDQSNPSISKNESIIKPEILILRELIEKMTGIVHIEDLTPQQIQALAGGRYIQLETTSQTNEFRRSRKSSSALEQFFWSQTINSQRILNQNNQEEVVSLAFLMLVVLCQQRSRFILNYHNQNLKPLVALYDNFTCSINQLTKCLLFQTDKPTHYAQLFPENPLERMVIDFKLPFEIAFHIVRYSYKSLYNMSEEEFQEEVDNIKNIYDKIDPKVMCINPDINNQQVQQLPLICHTYVKDILWTIINPELFAIFWLLSLDNIYVPQAIYDQQLKWLQENINKNPDTKDRQSKQHQKAFDKLQNELDNNKKRQEQFDKCLRDKKHVFSFKEADQAKENYHIKFAQCLSQVCLLPRILIDPAEAIYCAKFVQKMLKIGKPRYTYTFYVPKEIIYFTFTYLQCATEEEASNLSIFMQQLIIPYANWNDETKFKNDLRNYFDTSIDGYDREKQYIIQNIFFKMAQFIRILKNNETQVRNALIFLKRVQDIFPPTQQVAEYIKIYLQDVEKDYGHIQDIKTQIKNFHIEDKINTLPVYAPKSLTSTAHDSKKQAPNQEKMKSVGKAVDGEHEEYNHKEHSEERRNPNNKTESRQVPKKKKSHDKDRPLKRLDKS